MSPNAKAEMNQTAIVGVEYRLEYSSGLKAKQSTKRQASSRTGKQPGLYQRKANQTMKMRRSTQRKDAPSASSYRQLRSPNARSKRDRSYKAKHQRKESKLAREAIQG